MKRRSQDTADPTQRILNDSVQDLPQATLAKLGKTETIKRDLFRQRRINEPDVPRRNDNLFAIPGQFTLTAEGNQFLQYDNNLPNRISLGSGRDPYALRCARIFSTVFTKFEVTESKNLYAVVKKSSDHPQNQPFLANSFIKWLI